MTDRLNGVFVVFEKDIRTDDAESIIAAIGQIRGVLSVQGNVVDAVDYVAYERARAWWREAVVNLLWPPKKDG